MEIVEVERIDEYLNNQNFWYYNVKVRVNYDADKFNGYNGFLYEVSGYSDEKGLEKWLLPRGNTTVYYKRGEVSDLYISSSGGVYGTIEYRISFGIVYEVFDAVDGQFFFMLDGHDYRGYREMSEPEVREYFNSKRRS